MATSEQVVLIGGPLEEAFRRCAQAMARLKFKDVRVESAAAMVSGKRRPTGQWTNTIVNCFMVEASDGTVAVTVRADATAQSLVGLASSPSERLVREVCDELRLRAART